MNTSTDWSGLMKKSGYRDSALYDVNFTIYGNLENIQLISIPQKNDIQGLYSLSRQIYYCKI